MRTTHYSDTAPMKALFNRTIRHVPTGNIGAPLLVRSSGTQPAIVFKSAEYLVRCLVRRMANEAGAEVRAGMLPAEARVRRVFYVPRFRPYLREWCDIVNEARAVFKEFADGGNVPRGSILNACQSLARLEVLHQTENSSRFAPVRINPAINGEVMAIWENLDADWLLRPRSLAILHPTFPKAGALGTASADLIVDGTLIDVTAAVEPTFTRESLRLLVAKAAQAQLGGVLPKSDTPDPVTVDRIALLFMRQNRLMEFGIDELFGPEGWERYLDGFAELAGMERERDREMEPDLMPMMG